MGFFLKKSTFVVAKAIQMKGQTNTFSKFKRGHLPSFKELYELHLPALINFGCTYLVQQDEVEDIVQEAFIKSWEKRKQFDTETSFKAYLYTSVRNGCLNILKKQAVQDKYEKRQLHSPEEPNMQERLIQQEVLQQIQSELDRLPKAAKEVYVRSLEGLKNKEIAEDLGISVNTVKLYKKNSKASVHQGLRGQGDADTAKRASNRGSGGVRR